MTVLVGIQCTDGVVVGSDSAVTSGTGDGQFTTVHLGPKIDIIQDSVIIAHTGQVGMGQRFTDVVKSNWTAKKFKGLTSLNTVRLMCQLAGQDFAETRASRGTYGALVSFRTSADGDSLCEFAIADFQPELKTNIWYCSMGIGQTVVDPLLGLFRKAFWSDGPPNLSHGIFAATWALELAVELCPAHIEGPIKVAILEKGNARFLEDSELDSHRQNAEQALQHLGKYPESFKDAESTVPKP